MFVRAYQAVLWQIQANPRHSSLRCKRMSRNPREPTTANSRNSGWQRKDSQGITIIMFKILKAEGLVPLTQPGRHCSASVTGSYLNTRQMQQSKYAYAVTQDSNFYSVSTMPPATQYQTPNQTKLFLYLASPSVYQYRFEMPYSQLIARRSPFHDRRLRLGRQEP